MSIVSTVDFEQVNVSWRNNSGKNLQLGLGN